MLCLIVLHPLLLQVRVVEVELCEAVFPQVQEAPHGEVAVGEGIDLELVQPGQELALELRSAVRDVGGRVLELVRDISMVTLYTAGLPPRLVPGSLWPSQ